MEPFSFERRHFLRAAASVGLGMWASPASAAEPIAVVMGNGGGHRSLTSDRLRRIFLALPTDTDDGRRFVPVNLSQTSNVRERFDRGVLKLSPEEVARYWIDQRLRGNKPPKNASSVDLIRRVLHELPGAISYLPMSAVGGLRILSIDGRTPSDSGYALR